MNKMIKSLCLMVLLAVSMLAVSGLVSAQDITIDRVTADGTALGNGVNVLDIEKNNNIEVKVTITGNSPANQTIEDVQVSAYLRGNERDLIEDITDTFDVKDGVSYTKKLQLELPQRMSQKTYTLFIRVEDANGEINTEDSYKLEIDTAAHSLQIRDLVLNPENSVKAGRALLVSLRVNNRGESKEEDLKVKVSLPELGISASDYIDELDAEGGKDDSTSSEDLYLRVPDCAEAGEYTVKACVEYDEGDSEECTTASIAVVEGDVCAVSPAAAAPAAESKTIITIGPETQSITAGQSASYSVTLTNQGTDSKSYSVAADGASWATISMTPTNVVVLSPGESKSVFVNVAPGAGASAGEQMFSVAINSGDKVLKQVPLKANVVKPANASGLTSIKKGLEIGLVVLVVLLVILGLIIGFNKLKGSEDSEEGKEEQTYY